MIENIKWQHGSFSIYNLHIIIYTCCCVFICYYSGVDYFYLSMGKKKDYITYCISYINKVVPFTRKSFRHFSNFPQTKRGGFKLEFEGDNK